MPKILINCVDPQHAVTSIVPDEYGGAACAAQILIDCGHTQIALLTDAAATIQVRDRSAGVHQALSDAGLAAPGSIPCRREMRAGFDLARQALQADPRPTAMVCTRERLALGALLAARDLGLEVPADVSLISLDDGEGLTADLVPELATVQRPDRAMAEQAVALLLHEINSKGDHDVRQLSFACPASLGASVAVLGSRQLQPVDRHVLGCGVDQPGTRRSRVPARREARPGVEHLDHAAVDQDPGRAVRWCRRHCPCRRRPAATSPVRTATISKAAAVTGSPGCQASAACAARQLGGRA